MTRHPCCFVLGCLLVFSLAAEAASKTNHGQAGLTIGFESVEGEQVLDGKGKECARLEGKVDVCEDSHQGKAALRLHGAAAKGCVKFPAEFARDKQGTLDLWCKPAKTSGIVVGKYGSINISFKAHGTVYFGLKLKDGWTACESPPNSAKPGQWLHIEASWGRAGMVLFLGGKPVATVDLPKQWQWFLGNKPLLLGTYDWPEGYDVWFFVWFGRHGLGRTWKIDWNNCLGIIIIWN